jgi:hypothetical protein
MTTCPTIRDHRHHTNPFRIASSLRTDMPNTDLGFRYTQLSICVSDIVVTPTRIAGKRSTSGIAVSLSLLTAMRNASQTIDSETMMQARALHAVGPAERGQRSSIRAIDQRLTR